MNNYLEQIAEEINSKIQIFDHFHVGAVKDEEGRVTIPIEVNGNERIFAGIQDNEGNFFYIRHRDDFILYEESTSSKRFSACETSFEKRFPLRFVGVVSCSQIIELEAAVSKVLMTIEFERSSTVKTGRIALRQSLVDSFSVLREETKRPKKFDKFLQFFAIDFDLIIDLNELCSGGSVKFDESGQITFC